MYSLFKREYYVFLSWSIKLLACLLASLRSKRLREA